MVKMPDAANQDLAHTEMLKLREKLQEIWLLTEFKNCYYSVSSPIH